MNSMQLNYNTDYKNCKYIYIYIVKIVFYDMMLILDMHCKK